MCEARGKAIRDHEKFGIILLHRPREDLITRIRDHEKLGAYSTLLTL